MINKNLLVLVASSFLMVACSSENSESVTTTSEIDSESVNNVVDDFIATAIDQEACSDDDSIEYVCGVMNAEDLLLLGDTGMVLASGMSGTDIPGHLYLIDPATDEFSELIFGSDFTLALDSQAYPNCPGPLNLDSFSVHGLALNEYATNQFDLYFTSHGEREAIEMFDLDMRGTTPAVTWQGCVVLPVNTFSNSVAILSDGGFVTTKMMDPSAGFGSIAAGGITGNVFEWHPGGEVFAVAGTELSGANGIAISEDDRYMYVAAFGTRELVRFDRSTNPIGKESVVVEITPDNIRWGDAGMLLIAGGNYVSPDDCSGADCATGWSIIEMDAETMAVVRVGGADQNAAIQGVSSALQVGNDFWVGTFSGDRVGHFSQ